MDALLSSARLEKMKGMTIGFEPFPFLNHLLPQSVGIRIDQTLQSLADRGLPLIRYAGVAYIALAKKSGRADGAEDAGDIA
jgi:hypothetical protein